MRNQGVKFFTVFMFFVSFTSWGEIDDSTWSRLLSKNVQEDSSVDYNGFYDDRDTLELYLGYLASNKPSVSVTKAERLSYWLNIYNASTVYYMANQFVENLAVSIYLLDGAWDEKFIKVGDELFSLNQIEKEIVLGDELFDERAHFALVCASFSCPKLRNEIYVSSKLEDQLNDQARKFINNQLKNKLEKESVQISEIFKWYEKDFSKEGSVIDYINQYADFQIDKNAEVQYMKYDWNLNY